MTVAAPVRVAVELLRFEPLSQRTADLFLHLERTAEDAGVEVQATTRYRGDAPLLMFWGPGASNRIEPMARQIANGGHVACWDLAYWARDTKVRVSIDAAHPQAWVMRQDLSPARFKADRLVLTNAWNPTGPVVVAGIGEKATAQYGPQVSAWETQIIAMAKARGRAVLYRPKKHGPIPRGLRPAAAGPIEKVLRGASLVITWHSNVAVDAIRMGIPVICRDGAAAAVSASTWPDEGMPRPLAVEVQRRFLQNLAWFQWGLHETADAWLFLTERLA